MVPVGDETVVSPRNRVKFLCSYGGRILPRPVDGQLKYVGGETRVCTIPRDTSFSDLMKKLTALFESDVTLKYQLPPEDLDSLISVTCDEDLLHMLDEYDRHEGKRSSGSGTPRLRAFLFPATPLVLPPNPNTFNPNSVNDPLALEQRYIDAVNGIVRSSVNTRPLFTLSSGGSSPKSTAPEADSAGPETPTFPNSDNVVFINGIRDPHDLTCQFRQVGRVQELQRVHSSPNLMLAGPHNHLYYRQQQQEQQHHHQQHWTLHGVYRQAPPIAAGRNDTGKCQPLQIPRRYSPLRRSGGSGHVPCVGCGHVACVRCGQFDEVVGRSGVYAETPLLSPVRPPRQGV